jgi:histidine triad (HIT) family protein
MRKPAFAALLVFGAAAFLPAPGRAAEASAPCVFCEIVAGTRQTEGIVYRDERVTAFLSIGARNPGHTLIVPNAHAENFLAVPEATMHHMTDVAKVIMEAIKRTDLKAEGFMLQLNSGAAAGQSVFHAHLHIIPRYTGDAPASPAAIEPAARGQTGQAESAPPPARPGAPFPMSALAPVAAKIRAALAER